MNLERELLLATSRDRHLLSPRREAQMRWAITLARVTLFRAPNGQDLDLSDQLSPFRQWLTARLTEAIPQPGQVDAARLRHIAPSVALRMQSARKKLLEHHANDFGAEHLDKEIRHKKLALVLGGGGGSGFAHLGTFKLMDELGRTPDLLVGSSMGALLGLFRALEKSYSPAAIVHTVPRTFQWGNLFRPFNGTTRFGFPGAFHMQLLRPASKALESIVGNGKIPTFGELAIPLKVVAAGIRTGFHYSPHLEQEIMGLTQNSISPFAIRRKIRLFSRLIRELTANPRFLRQVVFGNEDTRDFNVVEAVGFSCSVPGLLCYDVFHDDPHTIRVLEKLYQEHRLWRMADGGIVNNVPGRVAWESVMSGDLDGSRNAFIFAGDVFAPVNTPQNLIFSPVQQIARANVVGNRPFCDYLKTFRAAPNPLNLLPGWKKIGRMIKKSRAELDPQVDFVRRVLTPLPPIHEVSNR